MVNVFFRDYEGEGSKVVLFFQNFRINSRFTYFQDKDKQRARRHSL